MESVVLVIHLILALAIICLVLIQRSEGGGLGMGGGSNMGGLTTAKGAANALTRTTAICAGCFFVTSLVLGILAGTHSQSDNILDQFSSSPAPAISEDLVDTTNVTPPIITNEEDTTPTAPIAGEEE